MTTVNTGTIGLSAQKVGVHQWVFGPIAAVTIPASAASVQIRGRATTFVDLWSARISARFVTPALALRATIISPATVLDGTLWTTAYVNYSSSPTCANVSALDGDYLVIEVGPNHAAAGSNDSADIEIGDTNATNAMFLTLPAAITLGVAPTTLTYTYSTLSAPTGQPALDNFATTNGIGGLVYSVSAGALPTGITLNTSTGTISGTPTQRGTFPVTITVTNSLGSANAALVYKSGTLGGSMGLSITMR